MKIIYDKYGNPGFVIKNGQCDVVTPNGVHGVLKDKKLRESLVKDYGDYLMADRGQTVSQLVNEYLNSK